MIHALVYDTGEYGDECYHHYIAEFPDGTSVEQMRHALGSFNEFEVLDVIPYAVAKPEKPKRRGKRFSKADLAECWSKRLQEEKDKEARNG